MAVCLPSLPGMVQKGDRGRIGCGFFAVFPVFCPSRLYGESDCLFGEERVGHGWRGVIWKARNGFYL